MKWDDPIARFNALTQIVGAFAAEGIHSLNEAAQINGLLLVMSTAGWEFEDWDDVESAVLGLAYAGPGVVDELYGDDMRAALMDVLRAGIRISPGFLRVFGIKEVVAANKETPTSKQQELN
jgi:hypothetical protein